MVDIGYYDEIIRLRNERSEREEKLEDELSKAEMTLTAIDECVHPDFIEGTIHERVSAMHDEINRLRARLSND